MNTPNVPTMLTLLRIAAIPLCVFLYYLPVKWAHLASAGIFALAAITDWLDGYLARYLKQMTRFGAFLDPVADKLIVAVLLVIIVGQQKMPFIEIPAAIIVGREILVSALREWMSELGKRTSVAVSYVGKVKTTTQLGALILLLAYTTGMPESIRSLGGVLLYISAILTIWSMTLYLKAAWKDLTLSMEQ